MDKTFADAARSYVECGGERRCLPKILSEIGDQRLSSIIPFDIKNLSIRLFPDHTNATRNRMVITPVSAVLNHAHERGWINHIRLRRFPEKRPPPKQPASQTWMHAFIWQCEKDNLPHLGALVLFMSQTGARVSEAINVTWPDIDLPKRTIVLRKAKGGLSSTRDLTDRLVSKLYVLRQNADLSKRVFKYKNRASVNEMIGVICRRAGIPYKSSHTCGRHTMATRALSLGVDIKSVMIAGGWKSASIFLETYANPRNSGRRVADSFNACEYDADT